MLTTAVLIFFLLKKEIALQMRARDELRTSEEKYRMVVNNSPDLLYRTDPEGIVTFITPSITPLTGYSMEETIGMNIAQELYLHPKEREIFSNELKKKGSVKNYEAQLRRKDGSIWWASTHAHFLRDTKGRILGVGGISRDVTLKKEFELALLAREQQLGAILEANPDPMVMYDLKGIPQYINPAFSQVFGWRFEELEGMKIPFVPLDQEKISSEKIKELYTHGKPLNFETKRYTKEKKLVDIILSAAVIKDETGIPLGMVVNLTDIS